MVLGFLVAVGSAWGWAWGAIIVVFFWAKSRWEDTLLAGGYGEEWTQWSLTTGALVPRMNLRGRRDGR
jgi:hypothetical protein